MIRGEPYKEPPAPFQPGDLVIFLPYEEGHPDANRIYKVKNSGHVHTQLEGRRYAPPNWQLIRVGESHSSYLRRIFGEK